MSIVFEEVTGEIVPDRGRGEEPREGREPDRRGARGLDEAVRTVLLRERRRAERLSDR